MTTLGEEGAAALAAAKAELRRRVLAARKGRPETERRAEDEARAAALEAWLAPFARVALYASKPPEPDVTMLLDRLGCDVLLPVLGRRDDGTPRREPDWAWYDGPGSMREGIWGIQEPSTPPLGAEGLALIDAVVCSGLAVDGDGYRCGVGGAWYDRALLHRREGVPVVIALNASEVVDRVPREHWDARVDAVATGEGVRRLH